MADMRRLLAPGTVLHDRYTIIDVLAHGGMSTVYRARALDRPEAVLAIKQMRPVGDDASTRKKATDQFNAEVALLSRLAHPSLVPLLDTFVHESHPCMVMPCVEGRDLDALRRERPFEIRLAVDVLDQLSALLTWLHGRTPPVIFRDLTPRNVLLTPQGRIVVVDLGLARDLREDDDTRTCIKGAGTPGFAPIEQVGGGTTDVRSDLHALGATIYTLLTGIAPPSAPDRMRDPTLLRTVRSMRPEVRPALASLVEDCMALHATHRPPDVGAVRARLPACVAQLRLPASQAPSIPPPPPDHRADARSLWVLTAIEGADRGGRYRLSASTVTLGRGDPLMATEEALKFTEASVSRAQATLHLDPITGRYRLEHETAASNPTRVNGHRVEAHTLERGDLIVMGRLQLRVEREEATRSAPPPTRADEATTAF